MNQRRVFKIGGFMLLLAAMVPFAAVAQIASPDISLDYAVETGSPTPDPRVTLIRAINAATWLVAIIGVAWALISAWLKRRKGLRSLMERHVFSWCWVLVAFVVGPVIHSLYFYFRGPSANAEVLKGLLSVLLFLILPLTGVDVLLRLSSLGRISRKVIFFLATGAGASLMVVWHVVRVGSSYSYDLDEVFWTAAAFGFFYLGIRDVIITYRNLKKGRIAGDSKGLPAKS